MVLLASTKGFAKIFFKFEPTASNTSYSIHWSRLSENSSDYWTMYLFFLAVLTAVMPRIPERGYYLSSISLRFKCL
jgi:hypothetical protein